MRLKQLTSIFVLSALMLSNSWALRGGPFDHLQELDGIRSNVGLYEGTIAIEDGNGVFRFVVAPFEDGLAFPLPTAPRDPLEDIVTLEEDNISNRVVTERVNAQISNTYLIVRGQVYYGNTYASVNISGRTVVGGSSGQSTVTEDLASSLASFAENLTAIINVGGFAESYSLSFNAKITDTTPQVLFSGKGEVSLFSRPPISLSTINIGGGAGGANQQNAVVVSNQVPQGQTTSSVTDNQVITQTRTKTIPIADAQGNVIGNDVTTDVSTTTRNNSSTAATDDGRPNAPLEPDLTLDVVVMGARVSLFGENPNEPVGN